MVQPAGDVAALFDQQAGRTPAAVALVQGDAEVTYRVLQSRVNRIASYLARAGVRPEDRVAVCADRGIETMAVLLAIGKAGGAYVPVEPALPPARMAQIIAASGARVVIAERRLPGLDRFDGLIALDEHADAIHRESADGFQASRHPHGLFAVLFTSGTTGTPKGIAMPIGSTLDQIAQMRRHCGLERGDVSLLHRPFSVVGSLWEHFGPLVHGVRSVILSGDDARDPSTIWHHLVAREVTHFVTSPTLAAAIVRHGERYRLTSTRLRFSMMAGEPVRGATAAAWTRLFPRTRLFICYGTTEASYIAMFDAAGAAADAGRLPAGASFGGGAVHVVNDVMEHVGEGAVGEICVSGARLARGYLDAPRLTAERFVPDPWAARPGAVLYRTGDLGRWTADGLEVVGRRDGQVKVRGLRVELDEVEAAVLRASRAGNAAVVARGDAKGGQILVAYLETAAPVVVEDLQRALRRTLPEHMVPSFFVAVPAIPLTSSGKPDRRALPEPAGLLPGMGSSGGGIHDGAPFARSR